MTSYIVTDFSSSSSPQQIDIDKELNENSSRERILKSSIKSILSLLKSMFYEEKVFLSETMDKLLSLTETTLQTHFGMDISGQADEYISFEIIDSISTDTPLLNKLCIFLQNVRSIVAIMGNLLYN